MASLGAVGGGSPPATRLSTPVSAAPLDLLISEYTAYLLRGHDDTYASQEDLYATLEVTGFAIGRRLAERMCIGHDRFAETLDIIKWICREFWVEVFRKPADRLQTNNRESFVLQDNNFRWLRYVSGGEMDDQKALALKYVVLPCGIIRGALAAFGLDCVVESHVVGLPQVVFRVSIREPSLAAAAGSVASTSTATRA